MKRAIGIILAIFVMNYVTYRQTLPVEWPLVQWTMYDKRADRTSLVRYRRFLLHRNDGTTTVADPGRPLRFLHMPYRLDALVRRDVRAYLLAWLKLIDAEGITYEVREWSLRDNVHQVGSSYRVMKVPPNEDPPARQNLVVNGSFDEWERSGDPSAWDHLERTSMGMGIDPASGNRSLIVDNKKVTQRVRVPVGTLTLEASVRSEGEDEAYIELDGIRSEACPRDGKWHRLSVTREVTTPGKIRVALFARGGFDDVVLSP